MDVLPALLLRIIHFLYALFSLFDSFWKRQSRPRPQPLKASRRRLPENLAILFVANSNLPNDIVEKTILQSISNTVEWCKTLGIPKLTLYEEHGLMHRLEPEIREMVKDPKNEPSSDSDSEYRPLTPSSYSGSRQISPCNSNNDLTQVSVISCSSMENPIQNGEQKQRHSNQHRSHTRSMHKQSHISLCLLSAKSSKSAIADVTRFLYQSEKQKPNQNSRRPKKESFTLTVDALDSLLENENGLSSPDFMIVHPIDPLQYNRTPLELHGFPPWHIRLTEIYHNKYQHQPRAWRDWLRSRLTYNAIPTALDEISFRDALDEFAGAEMRFGT